LTLFIALYIILTIISKGERFGNFRPEIVNCRGGILGVGFHGELTSQEINKVRSIHIPSNLDDQEVFPKDTKCPITEDKVEILYFPQETFDEFGHLTNRIISAVCSNEDCEYNTSKKE